MSKLGHWFKKLGIGAWIVLSIGLISGVHYHDQGEKIGGDGADYFLYCRNIAMYGDLDFHPGDKAITGNSFRLNFFHAGKLQTPFSIGPALTWLPLYATLYQIMKATANTPPTGYEGVLSECPGWVTVGLVTLGLLLLLDLCQGRGFSPFYSILAVVATYLGTFLVNYTVFEPTMAHGLAFFWVVLALWWFDRHKDASVLQAGILGLIIGMAGSTRFTSLAFLLLPGITWLWNKKVNALLFLCLGAFIAFLPQMLVWRITFGHMLLVPQGPSFMLWTSPHFIEMLFSPLHGLLVSHILFSVGLTAFFFVTPIDWQEKTAAAGIVLVILYVNSAASDFFGGWAFGPRRFEALLPFVCLGSASLFRIANETWLEHRKARLVALLSLPIVWNMAALGYYRQNPLEREHPLRSELVFGQLQNTIGDIFALPASLYYAAHYKVMPGQAEQVLADYIDSEDQPYVDVDPVSEPWRLLGGFGPVYKSPSGMRYRFLDRGSPKIGFAYRWPKDVDLSFRFKTADDKVAADYELYLNGTKLGRGNIRDQELCRFRVPASLLNIRLNILEFRGTFDCVNKNRIAIGPVRFSEAGRPAPEPY